MKFGLGEKQKTEEKTTQEKEKQREKKKESGKTYLQVDRQVPRPEPASQRDRPGHIPAGCPGNRFSRAAVLEEAGEKERWTLFRAQFGQQSCRSAPE